MGHDGKRYRILAIDDDPIALEVIEAALLEDFDVTTCASGGRARRILETQSFHVVCSDSKMPGMSGVELLGHVAQLPAWTAGLLLAGAGEYVRSAERSPHHVMLKPFDGARLHKLVLQLARLAEMKRSVTDLACVSTSGRPSVPPPSSSAPPPSSSAPPPSSSAPPSSSPRSTSSSRRGGARGPR
jgi:DNA-binding NtrC family response regulator